MSDFATLNGERVLEVRLSVPGAGAWVADVVLDGDAAVSGAATLVLGDLTLTGTVLAPWSGTFGAQGRYRVVAGAGGWSKQLPAKAYHNDLGIQLSLLLGDAAREAGETIETFPSGKVQGVDYVREAGPASRIFQLIDGSSTWWVGYDGITRIGTRPAVTPDPGLQWELLDYYPASRVAVLATETPSAIQVGQTISDSRLAAPVTVRGLELEVGGAGLRVRAWVDEAAAVGAEDNRLLRAIRALVRETFPRLSTFGLHRYRVVKMDNGRASLQAVTPTRGLPDQTLVKLSAGMAGLTAELTPGAIVVVGFADGDPSLPMITHYSTPDDPGFVPVSVSINAKTSLSINATEDVTIGPSASVSIDATDDVTIGPSAAVVQLGSGTEAVDFGQETGRVVRYGDLVMIAVVGSVAQGGIFQYSASAPNQIAKVKA